MSRTEVLREANYSILPLVKRRNDRHLLVEWVREETPYSVSRDDYPETFPRDLRFDLCIFDASAMREFEAELRDKRREERPVFLPFLLLISENEEIDRLITSHRGEPATVDEILRIPMHKFEFKTRIENMLERRRDSMTLKLHLDALFRQIEELDVEPYEKAELENEGETRDALIEMEERLESNLSRLVESRNRLREGKEELKVLNRVVRHDIRNDMNLVYAWSTELQKQAEGETEEMLKNIVNTSYNVLELTQNTKELIDTFEDEEPDLQPVELDEVLENVVNTRREMFDDAHIEILGDLPGVQVMADTVLPTVFKNIVNNAVQHSDRDHPGVEISVEEREESVVVSIADDGPGVSKEEKQSIFGKGERGLESQGTGIGLYLVNTLVSQYRGEVWIEDNEPRGAIFRVELRRARHPE